MAIPLQAERYAHPRCAVRVVGFRSLVHSPPALHLAAFRTLAGSAHGVDCSSTWPRLVLPGNKAAQSPTSSPPTSSPARPTTATVDGKRPFTNVLLQWEQEPAYFFLLLLPAMIYTALRGGMTYRVRLLNDCEQRSGYSPTWREYGPCYWLHVPGRLLFVFLCGSLLVHALRELI